MVWVISVALWKYMFTLLICLSSEGCLSFMHHKLFLDRRKDPAGFKGKYLQAYVSERATGLDLNCNMIWRGES